MISFIALLIVQKAGACRLGPGMSILEQMPVWTEEASFPPPPGEASAAHPGVPEALSIAGVPWVTLLLLLSCAWALVAAGGLRAALGLPALLTYGAKATPLILDRGETWRLFAANLLHKDALHLAFNAFALWNVGGALERALRPADYLALLLFTALGTTLFSALGSDSISLGASGMAFGVLGASVSFGWRRGVRGPLRSYFGLRIVPWLLALFAAGVGSAGVDNWGHAGGLAVGAALGFFLTPRAWPGEAAVRRLAAALGGLLGTLALGVAAAPALPALGPLRDGPAGIQMKVPLGWRKAGGAADRSSYSNGLSGGFRSSATLLQSVCAGKPCVCDRAVRSAIEEDLWRLADVGRFKELRLEPKGARLRGTIDGDDGQVQVGAACVQREGAQVALIVIQPVRGSATLLDRMAGTVAWPAH
jgi:rhomboid protease GluP